MDYFEVHRPSGDGACSDNQCPCPEVRIPRGSGYLYVGQELVELRRDTRSHDEVMAKLESQRKAMADYLGRSVSMTSASANPIVMCEQGAQLRKLDLEVAAADAAHWWETGLVPLRATPSMPTVSLTVQKFYGVTLDEAKTRALDTSSQAKIYDTLVTRYPKQGIMQGQGKTLDEAVNAVKARIPAEAIKISQPEIIQNGDKGVYQAEAQTQEEAERQFGVNIKYHTISHKTECLLAPKDGVFGLGKKSGRWQIQWDKPFVVQLTYALPAEVIVRYTE